MVDEEPCADRRMFLLFHLCGVRYMIPRSTMVKANMATEHQKYEIKSGGAYVVGVRTDTPDVPFGSSFQTLVQFKLVPAQNKKQTVMVCGCPCNSVVCVCVCASCVCDGLYFLVWFLMLVYAYILCP